MEKIVMAKKMENGVALYHGPVADRKYVSFNFEELIGQKINAFDLLENPQAYLIDIENRQVVINK